MKGLSFKICLLLLALFCAAGCDGATQGYPARQPPAGLFEDGAQRESGRRLFMEKCAVCHGKPDEGRSARAGFFSPPAPDFTEKVYRSIDPAYLFWRIEVGKGVEPYLSQGSVMPGWRAYFSDGQIWQLVAYLAGRAK